MMAVQVKIVRTVISPEIIAEIITAIAGIFIASHIAMTTPSAIDIWNFFLLIPPAKSKNLNNILNICRIS